MEAINPIYNFLQLEVEGVDSLAELALDVHWSWNHSTDEVWKQLDPDLWDLTHNPWVVLQTTSRDKLKKVLSDEIFRKKLNFLLDAKNKATDKEMAWFPRNHRQCPLRCVAYFSMEFMLSEALPIYSGGLGNVAGDQLKACSDLGIPVIGIGLLYQRGYFRQMINKDGVQEALFPFNDPLQLPVTPLRKENGEWLRLEIKLPGYSIWLRTWQVQVGRNKLYLLDTNDPANIPIHRGITSELYGGGLDVRFKQELVLGIGGWRLLEALNIHPEVCHLNEGHAAFAVLDRARSFMEKTGTSFEVAMTVTRAGNLFTTHTAVAAWFDHFPSSMIEQYLSKYVESQLHISIHDLLTLGRRNPLDTSEDFNVAYLALRGCGRINAVSRLHGEVCRAVFSPLFPRWPEEEVPISYVTNGVHMTSWDSAAADELWTKACGKDRWRGTTETLAQDIRSVSDTDLWQFRAASRKVLVEYSRKRLSRLLAAIGSSQETVERAKSVLNPNALTIGFARRFATYKRPNLLLSDPDRLIRILTDPKRPVQLIISGKAHPADQAGKNLIQQWIHFIWDRKIQEHVIFLEDYDMLVTEQLVRGVDVWLNTPKRPWEACGTSGMKVLVNGGINLSELDGWWAEAYNPEVGWALGDGKEHDDDPAWDKADANTLYNILEQQVIPEFYTRNENGISTAWTHRMRESMAQLTPQFSANRTVREYTENYYIPAATEYMKRSADSGILGQKIVDWKHTIERLWPMIRFGELKSESKEMLFIFRVQVYLNGLNPDIVKVQLYAEGTKGVPAFYLDMKRGLPLVGEAGGYEYNAEIPAKRPITDYTVRIIPNNDDALIPLETPSILWQK
ncbi:MAG: alpha-glucan family phosphorylase [Parachlamydiaceae bacterium]